MDFPVLSRFPESMAGLLGEELNFGPDPAILLSQQDVLLPIIDQSNIFII